MPDPHLYLCGFRGTGKTSVARALAAPLQRPVLDVDQIIESRAGRTIAEIFAQDGESEFRDLESRVIQELSLGSQAIISLGGGAVLRDENRRSMTSTGRCVWLDASPMTVASRIASDPSSDQSRPALTQLQPEEEIRHLMESRRPLYEVCADLRVVTDDRTIPEIADQILDWWNQGPPPK